MDKNSNIELIKEESETYSDDAIFNISSYGADLSFRELISMYQENELEKPELQRHYVWDKKEASRFIDSILLGLPVPSIFLAKTSDERRLIIDGYQRIMTVFDFVQKGIFGGDGKKFTLSNSEIINEKWRGKCFDELSELEKRKIRNTSIHAIIFEQKSPQNDTAMYQIFERINTAGRTLRPQEIRNCVEHGRFNEVLIDINKNNKNWRKIFSKDKKTDSRMGDVELILRMYAMSYIKHFDVFYKTQLNLNKYLNEFMNKNKKMEFIDECELRNSFEEIMNFFADHFDVTKLFRNETQKKSKSKKINPAILDSIFASTHFVLKHYNSLNQYGLLTENYSKLIENEDYQTVISQRTTNLDNIRLRIKLATRILYGVEYEW